MRATHERRARRAYGGPLVGLGRCRATHSRHRQLGRRRAGQAVAASDNALRRDMGAGRHASSSATRATSAVPTSTRRCSTPSSALAQAAATADAIKRGSLAVRRRRRALSTGCKQRSAARANVGPFRALSAARASGRKPVGCRRASCLAAAGARRPDRAEQVLRHCRGPADALHRRPGRARSPASWRGSTAGGTVPMGDGAALAARSSRWPGTAAAATRWASGHGAPSSRSSTRASRSPAGTSCSCALARRRRPVTPTLRARRAGGAGEERP